MQIKTRRWHFTPTENLELETELADVAEGIGKRALPHMRGKEDGITTVENR